MAEIGKVINHVMIILWAVSHLTPRIRWAEPTPKMADEITWVVLTGKCKKVAPKITVAAVKSAATPLTGRIFIIFEPTVLIILQPPTEVPNPIAVAQAACTQKGTSPPLM